MTRQRPKSIVLVNTGDGKGKTSAAIGMAIRGVARGWRVGVIQFVKSGKWKTGEARLAEKLDIDWWSLGDGFTWESEDLKTSSRLGREAWALAAKLIADGKHQLIILDEITYAMTFGWIPTADVGEAIINRPATVNVVLTGRDAPDEIIQIADTVTEMRNVKHAFDQGISAIKGIDF
ncbi:MAG: cob(I)yrinic acid a,c-diamide adenosyltransferase [Acidimicrobiia bacterium]|nr:MAG: cob(I)yrinic acid a,c-diamide adenosyltransferase [Acidimicrobiia bacterium]